MDDQCGDKKGRFLKLAAREDQAALLDRRTVLAQAAAVTAAVTVGAIETPAAAATPDPNSPQDIAAFILLSSALTGIRPGDLAPGFAARPNDLLASDSGDDPVNIKAEYFRYANKKEPAAFAELLQLAKDAANAGGDQVDIVIRERVQSNDANKILARSIVLMWYLGAWYQPSDLKTAHSQGGPIPFAVISARAYTQGWVWKIAQAHPMGYSELQFGYWTRLPTDPNDPRGPLGFVGFLKP